MYRLHGFCQSGNTFKVAFALRAMGQPFETVFVDFMNGATRSPDWRASTNEMGEAPVLEAEGKLMTQSGVILTFLADRHGKFGGRTAEEKHEILRWILFDNHKFTSYFASYRFSKAFGPAPPDPAVMNWLKGRVDGAYAVVDKHLAGREWMVGDAPTIADFSLSGYVFYPVEESGYDVEGRFPNIVAWRARLKQLPGWGDPYEVLPGEKLAPKW
ncbi:glutathione S-transferase family protein [Ramlibacter humi]|uniref:Glutathione S-transferase n=1 Tax=Ramlibacter humi TaxID=2530451 RepID=A0A4Z0BCW7_9BURK|nr:glutathione S-transferase [Ramlibacter humi]TFY97116.1 glutathione S-transferase [Ramlibacter humi]